MSTRDDARLTAEERAAFSNLEAMAMADDPQLASRLRGPARWHPLNAAARLHAAAQSARVPAWAYQPWFCVPALAVGLVLAVLSLAVGWWLGVLGAVLAVCGITLLLRFAARQMAAGPEGADTP